MTVITKKVLGRYFEKIMSGEKTYEVRLADFTVEPGDTLELIEINDVTREPTGRVLHKKAGSVIRTKEIDAMEWWTREAVDEYGYQVIALLDEEA